MIRDARLIRFRVSFLLALFLMIGFGYARDFFILFISVSLHEFAHMLAAKKYGARIKGLDISALGETAVVRGMEYLPVGKKLSILLIGPIVNLSLFVIGSIIGIAWDHPLPDLISFYNLVLFVFNLLPVLPLDGGRILQIILGMRLGTLRVNRMLAKTGRAAGWLMMAPGLVLAVLFPNNISLLCLGFYIARVNKRILFTLTLEFFQAMQKKAAILKKRGAMPLRLTYVDLSFPVRHAVERLGVDFMTVFYIDSKTEIEEDKLIHYITSKGMRGTISDVI